jgi:hypothetical protein
MMTRSNAILFTNGLVSLMMLSMLGGFSYANTAKTNQSETPWQDKSVLQLGGKHIAI